MILSHRYKFIFVKTGKVGGTSLEMALSRFLGPADIITPISWPDEQERYRRGFRTGQNFQKRLGELRPMEWPRWLRGWLCSRLCSGERRVRERVRLPQQYWNHMSAAEIRERVGPKVWDSYFKFTVERNPWDKVVSMYYWAPKTREEKVPFRDFVLSGQPLRSQFDRYAINGRVAVDRILRYDNLYSGLKEISEYLDLPEDVGEVMRTFSAKGGYRQSQDIGTFYDDETREIVDIFFAREIRLLGFKFGEWEKARDPLAN